MDVATYQEYTGVDISDVAISKARRRSELNGRAQKNHYIQSDILSYKPVQKFDVILLRDSLYYVPRRRIGALLDWYSKALKEDGVFIVRIIDGARTYKPIIDIIESKFEVIEKYGFDGPNAVVIVFRKGRHGKVPIPCRPSDRL